MSRRSKIRAASFGFMFSYMETMLLKRSASILSRVPIAVLTRPSVSLSSVTLSSKRFLGGLEQVFAHFHFAAARVEFLPAGLQAFKDRALAGRCDATGLERNCSSGDFEFRRVRRLVTHLERGLARLFLAHRSNR